MTNDLSALLRELSESQPFRRVRNVSFLGVVDRFFSPSNRIHQASSRADHSMGVLNIGLRVAKHAQLSRDDSAHLFAACLVHDIGHPPFSHSLEYAFSRRERKFDHHEVLREMLVSPIGAERQLERIMSRHDVSIDRVYSIVDGSDDLSFFFNSPINIDTVDGISRSMWSFGLRPMYDLNALISFMVSIYRGDVVSSQNLLRHADLFWRDKGEFYQFLNSTNQIAAAERKFQSVVRKYITTLERKHFCLTDVEFELRYPQVFADLAQAEDAGPIASSQRFIIDSSVHAVDRASVTGRYRRVRNEIRRTEEQVPQPNKGSRHFASQAVGYS